MNLDPRDIITADPYAELTSDEDEESQIKRELEEMERKRKDLEMRLKQKKIHSGKSRDPNIKKVQVPKTPEKKKSSSFSDDEESSKQLSSKSLLFDDKENVNEIGLKESYLNGSTVQQNAGTTSYFVERFQNSKKKEKQMIEAHDAMMSTRVHTFGNNPSKEYKPLIVNELEEFSNIWISKRYLPTNILSEALHDIKILRLSKLFAKVRPPKFQEPQYSNWAVLGILSHKSEVKFTSSAKPQKFIKLTMTNFNQQIDIFIFGDSGVKRYITLRVGDVVAILNPEILPWKPTSGGRQTIIKSFNLKIGHNYKCILEIGKSRDLGYCPVWNKSTNAKCGNCINISTDKCCEYHREMQMRSSNSKRLDLNGGYSLGAPTKVGIQPTIYRENSNNTVTSKTDGSKKLGATISKENKTYDLFSKKTSGPFHKVPSFNLMSRSAGHHVQSEEDLKKRSITAKNFTSTNAAKAFFDDDFHNPDMIRNIDNKRRKIQDTKSDKLLQRMFSKDEIELNKKDVKDMNKLHATTQTVLQSGIMQRLGFDPTGGKVASVLKKSNSNQRKNHLSSLNEKLSKVESLSENSDLPNVKPSHLKKTVVDELLNFKKDSCNLTPSKFYLAQRKDHRRAAWKEVFGNNNNKGGINYGIDDSDSDLEII